MSSPTESDCMPAIRTSKVNPPPTLFRAERLTFFRFGTTYVPKIFFVFILKTNISLDSFKCINLNVNSIFFEETHLWVTKFWLVNILLSLSHPGPKILND